MKTGGKKRIVFLAAAALVVAAAALVWWWTRPAALFAFHFPEGSEYVYRLDYTNHNATRIMAAVAARRRAAGDEEAAGRMNDLLLEGLRGAPEARERRHYLEALGNVGAAENVAAIAALAGDEDGHVRRSVARALRKTQTPEAEQAVLGLAGDGEGGVQQAALRVLDRWEVGTSHVESLSGVWEKKGVAYENWGELATLLGNRLGKDPDLDRASRELLVKVGSDPQISPKLLYRIRQMIE